MISKWDFLLEKKPVPLLEQLKEEVSKLLAKQLEQWPLPIQALGDDVDPKVAALVNGEQNAPSKELFPQAFQLAEWDLCHQTDAFDEYMRNQRWAERGLSAADKPALLFVSRWLLDQMTSLREATEGRVKRQDLVDILARTRSKWEHRP